MAATSCVTFVEDGAPRDLVPAVGGHPLRRVARVSPLIVRAEVEGREVVPYTYLGPDGRITVTRLRVIETLKGDAPGGSIAVRGMGPPKFDLGAVSAGDQYVVCLQASPLKGWAGHEPVGGLHGVKGGTAESCAAWRDALRDLEEIERSDDAATRRQRTRAWLVGLVGRAETRWDGAFDLLADARAGGALADLAPEQWRSLRAVAGRLADEEPVADAEDPESAAEVMLYWRRAAPLLELIALQAGRPDSAGVAMACYVSASRCLGTAATPEEPSATRRRLVDEFLDEVAEAGP